MLNYFLLVCRWQKRPRGRRPIHWSRWCRNFWSFTGGVVSGGAGLATASCCMAFCRGWPSSLMAYCIHVARYHDNPPAPPRVVARRWPGFSTLAGWFCAGGSAIELFGNTDGLLRLYWHDANEDAWDNILALMKDSRCHGGKCVIPVVGSLTVVDYRLGDYERGRCWVYDSRAGEFLPPSCWRSNDGVIPVKYLKTQLDAVWQNLNQLRLRSWRLIGC